MNPSFTFASIRKFGSSLLLALFGISIALAVTELAFKVTINPPQLFFGPSSSERIRYDREAGWEPVPDGIDYSEEGIYLKKSHRALGGQRIVFLGDSVVAQGYISDAFAALSTNSVEVLNAGVPGYETHQEVSLFEKRVMNVKPDIVIMLFHPNDFEVGISAVRDDDGALKVANSYGDALPANATLFWHSSVYQFLLQSTLRLSALRFSQAEAIDDSLRRLDDLAKENKFKLLVVTLPWFKWPENWSKTDKLRRETILDVLAKLNICHVDGYATLEMARGKIASLQSTPGDIDHPNQEFAQLLARFVYQKSFTPEDVAGRRKLAMTCE